MTTKNDGGSAFPHEQGLLNPGMTLRDYFAAQAMQGAFTSPIASSEEEKQYIAIHAYQMADAMLKARETRP